jgi:hypothetical protein
MTTVSGRDSIKNVLGQIPFTAELYWLVRQRGKPLQSRFSLKHLQAAMPELTAQAAALRQQAQPGRNIFIFATLHYWIEHAALLSLTLAAQGHHVTLGFLPYAEWQSPINRFDLRRQNVYARKVLEQMEPLVNVVPFLNIKQSYKPLPDAVEADVQQVSVYDTQYTLQVEEVNPESDIYRLRLERNQEAARMALTWLQGHKPDVVIVPNGTVQELGIVYRVARHLNIKDGHL